MTVKAYILIEAAIGQVAQVLEAVRGFANVTEVNSVAGPYDIIVVVHAETSEIIGQLVMEQIHRIDGVNYTMTCIAITG